MALHDALSPLRPGMFHVKHRIPRLRRGAGWGSAWGLAWVGQGSGTAWRRAGRRRCAKGSPATGRLPRFAMRQGEDQPAPLSLVSFRPPSQFRPRQPSCLQLRCVLACLLHLHPGDGDRDVASRRGARLPSSRWRGVWTGRPARPSPERASAGDRGLSGGSVASRKPEAGRPGMLQLPAPAAAALACLR